MGPVSRQAGADRHPRIESEILREPGVKPWPHKFIRQPLREILAALCDTPGVQGRLVGAEAGCAAGLLLRFHAALVLVRET